MLGARLVGGEQVPSIGLLEIVRPLPQSGGIQPGLKLSSAPPPRGGGFCGQVLPLVIMYFAPPRVRLGLNLSGLEFSCYN